MVIRNKFDITNEFFLLSILKSSRFLNILRSIIVIEEKKRLRIYDVGFKITSLYLRLFLIPNGTFHAQLNPL